MEGLLEKLGWKKFAIIIVILCFVMLGFAALSFMNMDRQQSETIKKNIDKTKTQGGSSNKNNAGEVASSEFKPFSTSYYQLTYPVNLEVKNLPPSGGAQSSVVLTDINLNTNIQIEVFAKPQNTLDTAIKPYIVSNYGVEKLPLRFDNALEFTLIKNDNPAIRKKLIFLDKKDKFIKISFEYNSSELDVDTERNFAIMLTSLR